MQFQDFFFKTVVSSVANPICQEGQSERNFPIFAFLPDFSSFFPIFPDFFLIFPDFWHFFCCQGWHSAPLATPVATPLTVVPDDKTFSYTQLTRRKPHTWHLDRLELCPFVNITVSTRFVRLMVKVITCNAKVRYCHVCLEDYDQWNLRREVFAIQMVLIFLFVF